MEAIGERETIVWEDAAGGALRSAVTGARAIDDVQRSNRDFISMQQRVRFPCGKSAASHRRSRSRSRSRQAATLFARATTTE
ncbi:hypothetical protein BWP39_03395 [Paraburkholderia acidicola]|uniref:Uncharacterized protein n=1 Tax=Paraburkholderia acidicola TaxID=1912599 RepID=A0A2A4F4E7_9BURK|nr:hypothetical protein BWP39_03395 [Paraburkholderia acidicola]